MHLETLHKTIKKEKINSVLIRQNGRLLFEYYKNGKQKDKLFKINSCTKSVLSILFGIAWDRQLLELDDPIHPFFPNLFEKQVDERKKQLTIRHLLTMTDGLDFPEFGEWESFAPMVFHHDIVKFVIDRPMIHEPGTHMNYSSGASHILSAILQQLTKMKTEEFAEKYLFQPLSIKAYHWHSDNMGITKGADGLVLKMEDMMKIGELMLRHGTYNGKQIVSAEWIEHTTSPNLLTYESIGYYGMHWWVHKLDLTKDFSPSNSFFFALGFGGQYIIVLPSHDLVIGITSELYSNSLKPMKMIREQIVSCLSS